MAQNEEEGYKFTLANSLLAQLLLSDNKNEEKEETIDQKSQEYVSAVRPIEHANGKNMKRIEPTVYDVILPPKKGHNYLLWSKKDVQMFLSEFVENTTVERIMAFDITGKDLYHVFLEDEVSEGWRRHCRLSQGLFMKIRMTLGNIHNIFYGL